MLQRSGRAVRLVRPAPPAHLRRKRERATPPNVVGARPLLSTAGLHLGVVVMLKNEAPYLPEWLAYHRALGVDHFMVYDNGSTDALREVIEPWLNHGLVSLMHWPLPGGQIDAYSHALRFYGPSFDWLAYFDVDEFVVPLVDGDIPSLLARWPTAADVRVPRVDFGFSGHRTPPAGLTIEAYTQRANVFGRDPAKPPRVKSILRPPAISAVGIHTATVADRPETAAGEPVPAQTVGRACHGLVQLNHYYTRSLEEFEAKRYRGSGTGRIARPAIPFDLPSEGEDVAAVRFAERTRAVLELMRSLAPSPYRYGSQLALPQFPRFNDLGLFAEFAIANTVAEEPEPRREPRLRIENRYAGIGFVGLIGAFDHEVHQGELSGSIHLGPLLERTRGSLVAVHDVTAGGTTGEVRFDIVAGGQRRCYALGFVVEAGGPALLGAGLTRPDGGDPEPLELRLDGAGTYAGVVELDDRPDLVSAINVRLDARERTARLLDLFVIAYG